MTTPWYAYLQELYSGATVFDLVVFVIFLGFIARGVWVGFIRQIAFIVAMVTGFAVAGHFHKEFYNIILPFIESGSVAFLLAYLVLFGVIYFFALLLGMGLRKVMTITMLGWFDRLMGGCFGFIKGLFVSSLLFMFLNGVLSADNRFIHRSYSKQLLQESGDILLVLVRDGNIRSGFYPKIPAIEKQPPAPVERMEEPAQTESSNTETVDALKKAAQAIQQELEKTPLSVPAGKGISGNSK
jgi:membrane protein required for colicin V production